MCGGHAPDFEGNDPLPLGDVADGGNQFLVGGGLHQYAVGTGLQDLRETAAGIWLIEFKLDRPAEEALAQIDERNYAEKYDFAGKAVRKLGISFSSEQRTIVDVRQG